MPDPKIPPRIRETTEEEWEGEVLVETLGDALQLDGSLDFDKLRTMGLNVTLDEPHSERYEDDEA
jgi:hypothetical protein